MTDFKFHFIKWLLIIILYFSAPTLQHHKPFSTLGAIKWPVSHRRAICPNSCTFPCSVSYLYIAAVSLSSVKAKAPITDRSFGTAHPLESHVDDAPFWSLLTRSCRCRLDESPAEDSAEPGDAGDRVNMVDLCRMRRLRTPWFDLPGVKVP